MAITQFSRLTYTRVNQLLINHNHIDTRSVSQTTAISFDKNKLFHKDVSIVRLIIVMRLLIYRKDTL